MRGDLPLKDDTAITDADVRTKNLILFGDPGSNLWSSCPARQAITLA